MPKDEGITFGSLWFADCGLCLLTIASLTRKSKRQPLQAHLPKKIELANPSSKVLAGSVQKAQRLAEAGFMVHCALLTGLSHCNSTLYPHKFMAYSLGLARRSLFMGRPLAWQPTP